MFATQFSLILRLFTCWPNSLQALRDCNVCVAFQFSLIKSDSLTAQRPITSTNQQQQQQQQ